MRQSSRSHNMFQDGGWQACRVVRRRDERLMADWPPPHTLPSVPPSLTHRAYMTSNAIVPLPSSPTTARRSSSKTFAPYRHLVAQSIL